MNSTPPLKPTCVRIGLSLLLLLSYASLASSQSPVRVQPGGTPEQQTARYFASIRKSPLQLLAFLRKMPKGGDLHNHLSGSIYAETYIQWAASKGLCVQQATMALAQPPCKPGEQFEASAALTNAVLYRQLIDAMSMRFWQVAGRNGHDHFFDTFGKFGAATGQTGQMLAEVAARAAKGRVSYMEVMLTPDGGAASRLGSQVGWDGDFAGTLAKLKSGGIDAAAVAAVKALREAEVEKEKALKCGTPQASPGCAVTMRYIFQVARGGALGSVFAQMTTGLALANDPNSKVVGLNLVQPEDGLMSMQNFSLHMRMLNFLRPLYPQAHITLHAGELAPGLVPPDGMGFHIRESVTLGGAERIGHGVSLMHEDEPYDLLRELKRRNVMIEICLTSNDVILGISKQHHPLPLYLQYGVPVALATDDEGVARSDISGEYLKAVEDHGLGYLQLKQMARASLEHAFLSGASLWRDASAGVPATVCRGDYLTGSLRSTACQQHLAASEKARLQWKLEEEFRQFERQSQ